MPGLYANLSFDEYKAIDAVNNSTLSAFHKLPILSQIEKPTTPAMETGIHGHTFFLEPEIYPTVKVKPANDERYREIEKSLLSGQYETARGLIYNKDAQRELSVVWQHPLEGCLCKARPDIAIEKFGIIADLKFGTNAESEGWLKTMINADINPHWQARWYLDGINAALKKEVYTVFLWILIETKPPWGISVIQPDWEMLEIAKGQINETLAQYLAAKASGIFLGYPDKIQSVALPRWYVKQF